jgi:enoyl-CoA hydratase
MATEQFGEHVRIETAQKSSTAQNSQVVSPLDAVATIVIDRPARRNAVDRPTAEALAAAFRRF